MVPDVGVAEIEPAQRATLVARWVGLGADPSAAAPASATVLPAGLAPGAGANIHLAISAPAAPGEYLLVLDVFDPTSGSLAALGVPPGIVRVTVTR